LNSIFEACSFQDVTGQRIRRAIQHLQHVETMLTEVMPAHTEAAVPKERAMMKPDLVQDDVDRVFALAARLGEQGAQEGSAVPSDMAQDDLDHLFSGAPVLPNGAAGAPALAQDDIDNMFAAPKAAPALPDDPPGKPELGQDDVDRMFG